MDERVFRKDKQMNSYGQRFKTTEQRFFEKVKVVDDEQCWEWKGAKSPRGYGSFFVKKDHDGKKTYKRAHRLSYELKNGEIPDGMYVLHSCDNPSCVNPNHLRVGTQLENVADMTKRKRAPYRKGASHGKAVLTELSVQRIRIIDGALSAPRLAKILNVTKSAISKVKDNDNWKHIKFNKQGLAK